MKNRGFTIVELLIVIVVIAILATISIVAYNGIQQRARDTQRMSDISNIAKAIQRWSIETGNDFSMMPNGNTTTGDGWYDVSYSGGGSIKSFLASPGYLNGNINDPQNTKGSPAFAYMLAECTTGDKKTRVVMANLEINPTQTPAQQLGGITCNSSTYSSYLATYGMDYVKLVRVD